ncbi:MAG TPA: ATPase [Pseudonocardiaceae bacterium]|nr:ATPase [Pseudonocardiaceae bacterium]
MLKPERVVGRDDEWATLSALLAHPDEHLRLGVVSGRRRVGKSYLLRALAQVSGGLYTTAVAEEDAPAARQRFAADIARYAGIGPDLIGSGASWESLLATAVDVVTQRQGRSGLLVIDELPYWLGHSPEIPGLLQLSYDQSQAGEGHRGGRVVLCGSAMSVMTTLLSGTKALRGRAAIDLRMAPFDLPTTARLWDIADRPTALRLHAALGGSPGYRTLSPGEAPQSLAEFDDWVAGALLNPGQALFSRSEAEYLLREDPNFSGSTLHYGIINAVARGASSPAKIGGLLERERTTLARPLQTLIDAGYLRHDNDPLATRRPVITVADPIIRFHNLITVAQTNLVESGRPAQAWQQAQNTFAAQILGPHFEACARHWLRAHAAEEIRAGSTTVAAAVVNDRAGHAKHEIDVLGLDRTSNRASIALIGEAKATVARRTVADLDRLDHIRTLLADQGHDTSHARIALFATEGFHQDVIETAKRRGDVLLADLNTIFGEPPVVSA